MTKFPYTVTESNITILIGGSLNKIPKTHAGFDPLSEHLKSDEHDGDLILQLLDKRQMFARLSAGKVKVVGTTVFHNGVPVHSGLARKLVTMMDDGYDATGWALFMSNVMENPSERSRDCLFEFLSKHDAPITDDGCFVAFKGVRENYLDVHSGTFDNSPGKTVSQDRDQCVEDPNETCAAGLHVCASHYLDSFWVGHKIIAVKVNPRDVVSVPYDYNYSKMRVCEYVVIGDVEDERHMREVENTPVIQSKNQDNVVRAATNTTAGGYILPVGYAFDPYDSEPVVGELVIRPGSDEIGELIYDAEVLDPDDVQHPDNDMWVSGDIARNDCGDYLMYTARFPSGLREFVVKDGEDSTLRAIVESEDDPEYCDECGDEVDTGDVLCFDCEMSQEEDDDVDYGAFDYADGPDDDDVDPEEVYEDRVFEHAATGGVFTEPEIKRLVSDLGQRGFARVTGVPRTTLQEWLKTIQ